MGLDTLSVDEKKRLKELLDQGLRVTQEIQDLKEGLRDTVKTVAEELSVKPSVISKAIRFAFKASMVEEKDAMETVEEILHLTGRL
jgi:hypothetical protein